MTHSLLKRAPVILALASSLSWAGPIVDVSIEKYEFVPQQLKIKAGTTVKWTNNEKRASHSVLFPQEGGLESDRLLPGDSYERTFDKPGTYPYTCTPHPEMKAVIEVTP